MASPGDFLCLLLGASNLSRGYDALARELRRRAAPRRVRLLAALGPGRGYSAPGGILNIIYPPIRQSALFAEAERIVQETSPRTTALVTDIGNDIMYGVPGAQIIADLQWIFERLHSLRARIFAVPIPRRIEQGVGETLFLLLRFISYPASRVPYAPAFAAIRDINRFLRREAENGRIVLLEEPEAFCGFDHIHYDFLRAHEAWNCVARSLCGHSAEEAVGLALRAGDYFLSHARHLRRLILSDMFPILRRDDEFF